MTSEPLTPENHHAIQVYRLLARQFVYDLHLAPSLLSQFCGDSTTEEMTDLLDRFELIHESQQRAAEATKGNNS